MCHTESPPNQPTPAAEQREARIPLTSRSEMPAALFGPDAGPPILLIADVFGPSPFYEHLAALLAADGFMTVLPDYFFRQGALAEKSRDAAFARRSQLDEAETLVDLGDAIEWIRGLGAGSEPVGVLGFCMGGTFALDLASTREGLVTVAYYGFPVPQASLASPPPRPIDLASDLKGPVLAFWGSEDEAVGAENVSAYVAAVTDAGADFQSQTIEGLGHGFLGNANLEDPSDPGGRTWKAAVDHFRGHLLGSA